MIEISNAIKATKKPVTIDAIKWTGDNLMEVLIFTGAESAEYSLLDAELTIDTLEGRMKASKGDYIIKGVKGEFYPCKPDIFHATYDINPRFQ